MASGSAHGQISNSEFLKRRGGAPAGRTRNYWAVFKDGSFCGIFSIIGLVKTHRALTYNKAELAYWLSRKYQGEGIMTEAGRRVLQFAFQELGLHKLFVSHFSINKASEKLIKRLGFRYVGEQLEEFQKDGVWHNHKSYELLEREFQKALETK